MTKKYISLAIFVGLVVGAGSVFASSIPICPTPSGNTEVGETTAALVGEVTNLGGDSSVQAWFQYGTSPSALSTATAQQTLYGANSFCQVISGLTPSQTYHYRAVAQNSAGTSYGTIYAFTTQSLPITVDILANGSQGPVTINGQSAVTLSWTSTNATNCQASGDPLWTGTKATYGSATLQLSTLKTYTFTLTCYNASMSQSGNDSVTVNVTAVPPTVITRPAIVTL